MKIKLFFVCLVTLAMISCIKDEPLYKEADIVSFRVEGGSFVSSNIYGDQIQLVMLNTDTASFRSLMPVIELSPGATITPASGVALDFTKGVTYKVTSEDGNYSKEYTVTLAPIPVYVYDFEEWSTAGTGIMTYPALADPYWASANLGIAMARLGGVDVYPTISTTDAHSGQYAALLQTQQGGSTFIGNIPLFSGSLFTGEFSLSIPALRSTHFGQPHPKEKENPIRVTGYYKYKPGEIYTDKDGKEVPGKIDECDIKAVLYWVTKGNAANEWLNGENIGNDPHIVAVAQLEDRTRKDEYTFFSIDFVYSKEPDYKKYDYKLALIFASSRRGDYYEGAVGSTLIIDDVEVVCEEFYQ